MRIKLPVFLLLLASLSGCMSSGSQKSLTNHESMSDEEPETPQSETPLSGQAWNGCLFLGHDRSMKAEAGENWSLPLGSSNLPEGHVTWQWLSRFNGTIQGGTATFFVEVSSPALNHGIDFAAMETWGLGLGFDNGSTYASYGIPGKQHAATLIEEGVYEVRFDLTTFESTPYELEGQTDVDLGFDYKFNTAPQAIPAHLLSTKDRPITLCFNIGE